MSPVSPMLDVLVVGAGVRARAWSELLERSPRTRVVGLLHRESLESALDAWPDAVVACALPPRAALEAAALLATQARRGLVQAPVHHTLAPDRSDGDGAVQVAHGWVTLPGRRWLAAKLSGSEAVSLDVRGLPEAEHGDLEEVLWHALALARHLGARGPVDDVRLQGESRLEATIGSVRLDVRAHGRSLDVRAVDRAGEWLWRHRPGEEIFGRRSGDRTTEKARPAIPAGERALFQLIDPDAAAGDDLAAAREVASLQRAVLDAAPRRLTIGARRLRHAARLQRDRPDALLDRLGLRGEVPSAPPAPRVEAALPAEPMELFAFRAGLKPVAFLTLEAGEEAVVRAAFGDVHIERLERRVQVGAQDAWEDRRDVGEARVELYVSRDPSLARRAAELQAGGDPSASLTELGALMGYPACCVAAFEASSDRSNNSRNRYASAAASSSAAPWPWVTNNLVAVLAPFYPCRYDCGAAVAWSRSTLEALEDAHPGARAALKTLLARPVLYFDHDHLAIFDGELTDDGVLRYDGVSVPKHAPPAMALFAGALAAGRSLVLADAELRVEGGLELRRTDPALGFLAPFAG